MPVLTASNESMSCRPIGVAIGGVINTREHANMRMKMFAAETLEAAKAMIFAEMGADAVILSEREIDGGVEVRAATDKLGGGVVPSEPLFLREARGTGHGRAACVLHRCSEGCGITNRYEGD